MPFITNDFNSLLVDDDDYEAYPEKYKYFVVARRLFVSSKEPFSQTYLLERFNKYGPIESAKILRSKTEGFVTFVSDRHACLAYNKEKDKDQETRVMVDSTWHQPDEAIHLDSESEWSDKLVVPDEQESPSSVLEDDCFNFSLFDRCDQLTPVGGRKGMVSDEEVRPSALLRLDDYSLFNVFDRCDPLALVNLSRTCKRLKQLLNCGKYYFPRHKKFSYPFRRTYNEESVNEEDVENIFLLMGHCFDELNVWFNELHDDDETIVFFVERFVKYCSSGKIRKMTFGTYFWENETWEQLKPILRNLTTLRVACDDYDDDSDDDFTVDFMELCPNLRMLIVSNVFIVDKCLATSRPSLKSFQWKNSWSEFMNAIESFTFFEKNRQITDFDCGEFDFKDLDRTVQLLPNIETLSLYEPPHRELKEDDILRLKRFKNLRKLTLSMTDFYSKINPWSVIESCGKLKFLSELRLYFTKVEEKKIDQTRLTHISNALNQLRHLTRLDLYCVQLSEEVVINFAQVVTKTKTIHLHECSVYATKSLLMKLGTIISHRLNGFRLYISNDKRNNLVTINNRKVACNDWKCSHRFRQ